MRKENEIKLHEIVEKEELENDCKNINEIRNKYSVNELIRRDSIKHLEELRIEYIAKNPSTEYYIANKVFEFLKKKA